MTTPRHIYIYIYIHIYIHIHMYIHACMHACMHAYIHTYVYIYILTYIHTYLHTYIPTYLANGYATRAPFIYPCRDPIHIQPNGHNIDDHFGSRIIYCRIPTKQSNVSPLPLKRRDIYNHKNIIWGHQGDYHR